MTPKQELFCLEYLKDRNATAAYMRAGYKAKGHAAEANASRLLSNAEIAKRINAALSEVKKAVQVEAEDVLREILKLAKSDVRKLYREDGTLKLPHEWDDDTAAAVAGVDVVETTIGDKDSPISQTTKKVKLWDKKGSLELLGRHLKLFTDVVEVKDVTPISDRMKKARERAKGK